VQSVVLSWSNQNRVVPSVAIWGGFSWPVTKGVDAPPERGTDQTLAFTPGTAT
jgi:hypothetical protein